MTPRTNSNTTSLVPNVHPLAMGSSELILQDDEGNVADLQELSSAGGIVNPDNATINIENSTDVIIGSVTQFNGPVTIYQNVNGPQAIDGTHNDLLKDSKLVKSESTSSDVHPSDSPSSKKSFPSLMSVRYVAILIVAILVVTVVVCAIKFTKDNGPPEPGSDSDISTEDTPIGSHLLIYRKTWGGRPAKNFTKPLKHPVPLVIVSHTVTPLCSTIHTCSARVKSIQEYHVGHLGSPDIGYNFLIGGDGNAYVGRGWDITNFHRKDSIGIAFIGNFVFDELNPEMIETAKNLLELGVKRGHLGRNYKLVAHNQTFHTESPGVNVYRIIKTWPHFDPTFS